MTEWILMGKVPISARTDRQMTVNLQGGYKQADYAGNADIWRACRNNAIGRKNENLQDFGNR